MISLLRLLTPPAQELLVEACGRFHAGQAEALRRYFEGRPHASTGTTRQAAYGQLQRAVTTGTAGTLALATVDARYHQFALSNDFALLKAYSPSVYSRYDALPAGVRAGSRRGIKRLVSDAAEEMTRLSALPGPLSQSESVRAYSLAAVLAVTLVDHGPALRSEWHNIFLRAERAGSLSRPYFRANFCYFGSFVGEWTHYLQWLMDPANRQIEEGDLVCFSREDAGESLFKCVTALVAGKPLATLNALQPARPEKTAADILGFARGAAHRASHFRTPGLVGGVLSWALLGRDLVARLEARHAEGDNETTDRLAELRTGVTKVSEVLDQEKARFWRAIDDIRDQQQREFMLRCWASCLVDPGSVERDPPEEWFFGRG